MRRSSNRSTAMKTSACEISLLARCVKELIGGLSKSFQKAERHKEQEEAPWLRR